ncbi:MAG: GDP-mannose 4,6-dehydratase [bacterium]
MAILITGANGFVGSHLINHILSETDKKIIAACWGMETLPVDQERVFYYPLDLTNFDETLNFIKTHKPRNIYHLASQSSVRNSIQNPMATFEVNIMGTIHLLEAVRLSSPASKLLFIGSGEVYGTHDRPTKNEEDYFAPVSPYASSKAAGDLIAYQYFKTYGIRIFRTRSYSHTGPGQEQKFVLSSFARKVCEIKYFKHEPIIFTGNIDVERDFLDVRDVVRAYVLLMNKGIPGEAYNVCSSQARVLRWILERMLVLAEVQAEIHLDTTLERSVDNPLLLGNNAKLMETTGWAPQVPFDTTLNDLIDYWKNVMMREKEA